VGEKKKKGRGRERLRLEKGVMKSEKRDWVDRFLGSREKGDQKRDVNGRRAGRRGTRIWKAIVS